MSFEITLRASVTTAITVMPSLPPVSTPKFGRRVFIGRLRLQVSEELANVTSITVVGAGAGLRRLGALGELLVEYTVLQPEGSEEDTSEHVEALMAQVYANSTALTATNAMAEVDPEFAASRFPTHARERIDLHRKVYTEHNQKRTVAVSPNACTVARAADEG
ncbi:Putative ADP-ribosylation factor GTPase-activating protein AGD9 [Durusdinium trenchii]|uniref:ADP-ribosylation factor GTPase-activating protein AGD9 n=1 Tax=Durusdinium trenchii TaxID=1381693 RepID=A0ABP0KRB8_9DINO